MKLLTCHVENFGKLSDLEFDFTKNPYVINEHNGWGKSTLAAFIKVMIYGFSNEGKRKSIENERKRYSPWQKGRYGGELTFLLNGVEYEISRTFGTKEKEDEFSLRFLDTNLPCNDYSSAIGEEIFKIDQESFIRTVFIAQNNCITKPTDNIHAKIGNLAENTDDINNYKNVDDKLKDLLNNLSPTRKTGQIKQLENRVGSYRHTIEKGSHIDAAINECTSNLQREREKKSELKSAQEAIQSKIKRISESKDLRDEKREYERICRYASDKMQQLKREKAYFCNTVPTEAEIQIYREKADSIKIYQAQKQNFQLTKIEKENYVKLKKLFASGYPNDDEIEMYNEYAEKLEEFYRETADLKPSKLEETRLNSLKNVFASALPDDTALQEYIEMWNQRVEKKSGIGLKKATLNTLKSVSGPSAQAKIEKSPKQGLFLLILGVLAALAGGAGLFINVIAGAAVIGLGVLLMIASFVVKKNLLSNKREDTEYDDSSSLAWEDLKEEIIKEEILIQKIEEDIQNFFLIYQMPYQESKVLDALYELKNQIREYRELSLKKKNFDDKNTKTDINILENSIRRFLAIYYSERMISSNRYQDSIQSLSNEAADYQRVDEKLQLYLKAEVNYNEAHEAVVEFIKNLGLEVQNDLYSQLEQIRDALKSIMTLDGEVKEAEMTKRQFEATHHVSAYQTLAEKGELPQLTELSNRLDDYSKELDIVIGNIQGYEKQIEDLQAERMEITEAEEELQFILDEKKELEHKHKILSHTKDFLEISKENFTAKYMDPVMQGFQKYYKILAGKEASEYRIDAHINITAKEQGMQRDTAFLSVGFQDLIGLCMRMAMVDVMFPEEKPFLIFDDSFVNLDDEKLKGGLKFLNEIAKEYQVIYFTCHASRI